MSSSINVFSTCFSCMAACTASRTNLPFRMYNHVLSQFRGPMGAASITNMYKSFVSRLSCKTMHMKLWKAIFNRVRPLQSVERLGTAAPANCSNKGSPTAGGKVAMIRFVCFLTSTRQYCCQTYPNAFEQIIACWIPTPVVLRK